LVLAFDTGAIVLALVHAACDWLAGGVRNYPSSLEDSAELSDLNAAIVACRKISEDCQDLWLLLPQKVHNRAQRCVGLVQCTDVGIRYRDL
jgi:hypothetical protein